MSYFHPHSTNYFVTVGRKTFLLPTWVQWLEACKLSYNGLTEEETGLLYGCPAYVPECLAMSISLNSQKKKGLCSKVDKAGGLWGRCLRFQWEGMGSSFCWAFDTNGNGQSVSLAAEFTESSPGVGVIGSFIFWRLCLCQIKEIQIRLLYASF